MNYDYAKQGTMSKYAHIASRLLTKSGSSDHIRLTIAIPTYKRATLLRETLQSVQRQTADPATFEVVVVDNDPEGDDAAAVEMISGFGFCNFSYYRNGE